MKTYNSKLGLLKGIESYSMYDNGVLKECILNEYNELETMYGTLIPQYDNSEARRKYVKSLSFYGGGQLQSISLEKQIDIKTPAGTFPAELITFYQSGSIKRLFPLNGKITGYWTEKDEYNLAKGLAVSFPFGSLTKKIIGIQFYKSGEIKSLTLWPDERVEIPSPAGMINTRIGLSFYPGGSIKSLEPESPVVVNTEIGEIYAYDSSAVGINGDINSLCFYEKGNIESLVTSTDIITVQCNGKTITYGPSFRPSLLDYNKNEIVPLRLYFKDGFIMFEDAGNKAYDISECNFTIKHLPELLNLGCGDCSNCTACG
ncbi:MAG: hypothetical protein N3B21_07765 [Clostridia bacterium]|nr:hypothetical protein [Clostridia bacterium]